MELNGEGGKATTYCVTGASGYIGSWLVNSLLERGYTVHATLRDLAKSQYFQFKWKRNERLRLFQADLQDEGSFDEAVKGCHGVFHVAASMEFDISPDHVNLESYVQSKVIDPAMKGVRNVLGSCLKSNSVKRAVFTSSISTLTAKDENERWRSVVDETCKTPIDHVLKTKASGWVYVLSKLVSEEEAFRYAKEKGMDLVSVITTTVSGPFLTPSLPSSLQVLLSPITGDSKLFAILSAVNKRMGSIGLVHIEDICMAHLLLMEEPKAEGQYICCVDNIDMHELMLKHFSKEHLCKVHKVDLEESQSLMKPMISSKKLRDLGFEYKYSIDEIIRQTIDASIDFRFPTLDHKLK
ncbi:NAD(P)-binding Rossmann-fold superfamily protein [Raphanus sativus]|uniref:Dihydroflavonol 4-reductase-like isoform X2 n=1 Tax=Raphanus sativus TaxID=3726 RepID=A0A9W3CP42_RAPSA|nr:dihydroflavonol 4-reductase-like isoform X2 [Raphanus sativus]KAJ4871672.1 NAD(P)-binding Rossmann-fold superfamily protein [Raphanus sativus]